MWSSRRGSSKRYRITGGRDKMTEHKIGDKVFVVADNYGQDAVIIAYRDSEADVAPVSHWKVRTEDGQEFWAFDFEISERHYDSTADTLDHIGKVQSRIHECTNNLIVRAE